MKFQTKDDFGCLVLYIVIYSMGHSNPPSLHPPPLIRLTKYSILNIFYVVHCTIQYCVHCTVQSIVQNSNYSKSRRTCFLSVCQTVANLKIKVSADLLKNFLTFTVKLNLRFHPIFWIIVCIFFVI